MKIFIAIIAIVSAVSVQAQSDVSFGDLNFFVKQGQFNLLAEVGYTKGLSKESPGGTKTKIEGWRTETRLNYGLTDQFNLFVGLDHKYAMETLVAGTPKYNQDGFANPILGANLRLLNQSASYVFLDVGFLARVNMMDAEEGDSDAATKKSKDGNGANGRNSYELNASVGRKWNEANEWRVTSGFVHNTSGDRDQLAVGASSTNVDIESSTDAFVRAAYQYRPVHEFMMTLAITGTRFAQLEEKETGVKTENDAHLDFDGRFTARYLILENLIIRFNMSTSRLPDYDVKTGSVKTEIKSRTYSLVGLGVDFLF